MEVTNACPNTLNGAAADIFLTLINTLMATQCALNPEGRYPIDFGPQLKDGDEFDFIIVGAGSAGSIVANRLSEVTEWKVLLVEAGGYPSATTEIPALFFNLQNTEEDWKYKMDPSSTCCLGLENKVCNCPRGKALGGTSLINGMLYFRSNRQDHNVWVSKGNAGWEYDSSLYDYRKIESVQDQAGNGYGKTGNLKITQPKSDEPLRDVLAKSYENLELGEYSEEKPLGYRDSLMTLSDGTRFSAAKTFLAPIKNRTNFYLALHAFVDKVLINAQTAKVEGVQVKVNQNILKLRASKEVIISAGAINSPQILMNSGIGPKEHLQEMGIDVVRHLKVGENFQDHLMFPAFFLNIGKEAFHLRSPHKKLDDIYCYFVDRTGGLSDIGLGSFVAFASTKNDSNYPDVQFLHTVFYQNDTSSLLEVLRSYGLPQDILSVIVEQNQNSNNLIWQPILLNPKSRGRILLRNSNPYAPPVIIPNFLSSDEDLETLLKAIKLIQKLTKTEIFRTLNPRVVHFDIENCQNFQPGTNNYWKCAIKNLASTAFHPAGTCKMGPSSDPDAVVDPTLKVHGIKGVRVIDASVMPDITSCNLNGPIFMIGEKGSQLVKDEWNYSQQKPSQA